MTDDLNLPKSTVHENLAILVDSGFVEKRNEGSKWVYYELTEKGKDILHPQKSRMVLLLSSAALSYVGGILEIYLFVHSAHPEKGVKGVSLHPEYLILGIILLILGTVLLYLALRKKR